MRQTKPAAIAAAPAPPLCTAASRQPADSSVALATPHAQANAPMPTRPTPKYPRVILKISGESFAKPGQYGIDPEELGVIAKEIVDATHCGSQVAVVVGGGNIVRGAVLARQNVINQSTADYMGMLGTVINGMALKEALAGLGQESRLMSAIDIPAVAERFIRARALRHFEKGRVLILAAGTGNPFFTTDTCAALRGTELSADILLKATKVDGVYTSDPKIDPTAKRFDQLTFAEALQQKLKVMDLTALTMCMEHHLPVIVFDFKVPGNIRRVVEGERLGTLVTN
jgi:uridylate kinase